jgi:hypothetical protein
MKRALVFMLVLFTGLMAYGGQAVNGPGILGDVINIEQTLDITEAPAFTVGMSGDFGALAVPVMASSLEAILFDKPAALSSYNGTSLAATGWGTLVSISDIASKQTFAVIPNGKGGVAVFDGSMKSGYYGY